MVPSWVAKYVGIPFVPRGRSFSGCDCYGLVTLVYAAEFSRELPSYSGDYTDPFAHEAIGSLIDTQIPLITAERLTAPELGSVAVIRFRNQPCHIGVYVGDGLILHSRDIRNGSVLESVDAPFLAGRVEGYYRVR